MSSLKLAATGGGGTVELKGPAATPNNAARTIQLPNGAGVIVQVIQTLKTDVFTTNTEDSWVDVTGMSVSITPTSTNSKILISLNTNVSNGSSVLHMAQILRGSTAIGVDTFASVEHASAIFDSESDDTSDRSRNVGHMKIELLDSPSTTSATTYKMQLWKNASGNMHVNRRALNTAVGSTSTITAYEVAG